MKVSLSGLEGLWLRAIREQSNISHIHTSCVLNSPIPTTSKTARGFEQKMENGTEKNMKNNWIPLFRV